MSLTAPPVAERTVTFLDLADYPELAQLADNVEEYQKELASSSGWFAWQADATDPSGHCAFLTGEWDVSPVYFGLWGPGDLTAAKTEEERQHAQKVVASLPKSFPKLYAAISAIPYVNYAAFSRLAPRSKLDAHTHQNPHNVTFHLGLKMPPGGTCGTHCGDDQHIWQKNGEAIIFDDNLPHGAWNDSDEERVVLHISIRRDKNGHL